MVECAQTQQLLADMQHLVANGFLPDNTRKVGERLINRLSSAISVVLLGPDSAGKAQLFDALSSQPINYTQVTSRPFEDGASFAQADICIWCTSRFDAAEQSHWQKAPDRLKDHSFLVPIIPEDSEGSQITAQQLDVFDAVASEEFHSMYPIRLGAGDAAGSAPANLGALIAEIAKLVKSGRVADKDNALFFLKNNPLVAMGVSKPQVPKTEPEICAMPEAAGQADAGTTHVTEPALMTVCQMAFDHISERANDLPLMIADDNDAEIGRILTICQEATESVAEMFADTTSKDPGFEPFKEDLLCAADKLLLMSMEGGVAPAVAAVTTLLQARREIKARIAC